MSAIPAKQSESPYLANPVALHRYINKTVPNIAIIVDNSNIMNESMASQHKDENPRYIDVVKDALMKVYPDTYGTHNLALITLTDVAKDMHWKVDQSQPSGYLFASGINNDNIFYSNEPNFNPYDIAPIASDGTLQRSVGSGNGKQNYGFNKFKDSRLVGGIQTYQTYVPGLTEQQKNTMGMTLLVPLLTQFNSNYVFQQQQDNLNLLTKTISLGEGRIRDVLPQTVDYLVNNIKYRCQDSYILVITNDISEVMDDVNRKAIGQYAKNHPKSSDEKDAEGYFFNQLDFPDQYYNMQPEPNKPGLEELDEPFPYVYEFAYMPGGAKRSDGSKLMEHYKYRADPAYGDESKYPVHEYGISGQIAYRTTNKNQTFMVGSLGQGGFGAFALNIAGRAHHDQSQKLGVESMPKPSWGENSFLWDTNSNAFGAAQEGSEAIGHILGRPVIARVAMSRSSGIPNMKKDVRYIAVLPSGEFGDQNKDPEPTLYIYDALGVNVGINQNKKDITAGKLIRKVSAQLPKGISLKYRNSLSAPTLVDLTFDGVADIGYVGDLNGHLYRLDLRGDNPDAWTLKLIYEGSDKYPITQAPSVSRYDRKNVVIFGTGSYTKKDDFNGHIVQNAIYGIFENDTFTAFQDEPLTAHSNFIDQTLSHDMNKMTRSISNHEVDKEHIGWRILLSSTAREGLSQKPVVFNGTVFFQTYVLHDKQAMPDNAMCYRPALSPDTWLFQINARTGAILNEDKDTRLEEMGKEHAIQFDGTILPTLKLVRTDQSSSTSKDGEMQNGNDPDFELVELESLPNNNLLNKGHYLNEEGICNAIVTNGMTLVCPPYKQVLTPGRLSIMKHSAK